MRHQLKPNTPSAGARLRYITREGRYAVGLDGPRADLRATGSANLPGWAGGDAAGFWAAADSYERANARRCLELELNLPRELDTAQQVAAVQDYLARLTAEAGPMPCTWAIHDAGDGNPHCHLMLQERPLDGRERAAETWFKRANRQQPERGGAAKSTWWHSPANVFWSRALWADACNQALIQGGHEARFDARSKSARFEEALERGDWLGAVLLSTITERHEGVAVAGMRRRIERGECSLEDLPDYAQRLIAYNDDARAHNCTLRDWARSAPEAELLAYLAPELERRNPSAHVAAWEAAQQVQAFDEDRQRAVAAALQAGELELLGAAEIDLEQDEHQEAQAHGEALLANVDWHRAQMATLEGRGAGSPTSAVRRAHQLQEVARQAKRAAEKAAAEAASWRQAHPVRAALADKAGITLATDRAADEAKAGAKAAAARYRTFAGLPAARQWVEDNRALRALQERLPVVERAAGIEPQADREARNQAALDDASRALRRASGLVENEMTRATRDEARELGAMRREIEAAQREIERLREQLPEPADALERRAKAAELLQQVEGWRVATDAAQAEAEQLEAQQAERAAQRQTYSDEPSRKPRSPRL